MAALTTAAPEALAPVKARRTRPRYWRGAVLAIAGLYFVTPLLSSFVFTVHVPNQGLTFEAYSGILSADGFTESLFLSLSLAAATIALALLLVVPALVAVRLGPPRLRAVVEVVCMLPLVVPPIALVTGIATVLRWGPTTSRAPRSTRPSSPCRTSRSRWCWSSPTPCWRCRSCTARWTRDCARSTSPRWWRRPVTAGRAGCR
ncbi:hypothetical protein Smic_22560 [Streptomyces microflavus]|uniref:ABC transmembrane type-1 domain-containing protein n=1 Tax=Streptomyces microflavus TaxID=1919 RepID=A0A7J0CMH1_STRMI|nr:hypothetical protein Smic_22560 [Streptomyces microflavus]